MLNQDTDYRPSIDNNLPKFHKIMDNVEELDFLEYNRNDDEDFNEFNQQSKYPRYNQRNGRINKSPNCRVSQNKPYKKPLSPKSHINSVISDLEFDYDTVAAGNSYGLMSSVPSIVIDNSDDHAIAIENSKKFQTNELNDSLWYDFQVNVQSIPPTPSHSPCPGTSGESTIINLQSTPQLSTSFTIRQEDQNSPTSSNHSYGDVPSPANYQTPINQRAQDQLEEGFDYLTNWAQPQDMKDVPNGPDNIDNTELQLVEEVLRDLSNQSQIHSKSLFPNLNNYIEGEQVIASNPIDRNDYCPDSFISDTYGYLFSDHPLPFRPDTQRVNVSSNPFNLNQNDGCDNNNTLMRDILNYNENIENYQTPTYDEDVDAPGLIFHDFQIPKSVSSYEKTSQRKSKKLISPWPSLNLPAIDASERLKESLDSEQVEKAMSDLLKKSNEFLARADEDGDTLLMCLVGNPEELSKKRAYLVPLVERLSNIEGALSMTNNRGEDALYLAATNCPRMAYVTGYLAATMLEKGIDINQRLYHTRGDTLIHSVASKGDAFSEVLAELLALKTIQGNYVFDLSIRNYDGRTALHVAVESHDPTRKGISSLAMVSLLLTNGADSLMKEIKSGDTALHMAVSSSYDPDLVKVLINKKNYQLVNMTNYNHDTPLHVAAIALGNNVSIEQQKEVCLRLILAGAQNNLQNRQGKTPLALVSPDRKEMIKRVFNTKLL